MRMVALAERRLTFVARNLNQVAAAGPKTASRGKVSQSLQLSLDKSDETWVNKRVGR